MWVISGFLKMLKKHYFLMPIAALYCSMVFGRTCDDNESDRAEYYAEMAGRRIVKELGGGQDIVTQIQSCTFNNMLDRFKVGIETQWNGAILRFNHYAISGFLELKADGSEGQFKETGANQLLQEYRQQMIGLGILALSLGALGDAASKNAPKNNYTNKDQNSINGLLFCNKSSFDSINVSIAYYSASDKWVSSGWSVIDKNKCDYAISGALRNRYFYYYVFGYDREGVYYQSDGIHKFCIDKNKRFYFRKGESCPQNTFGGFKEIDLGVDARTGFVQNIYD